METDTETDLRWYYTEAAGACGLKSNFGAQLEFAKQRNYSDKYSDTVGFQWKVKERPVFCCVDMIPRNLNAASKANKIAATLRRLTNHQRVVLELQHSCDFVIGDNGRKNMWLGSQVSVSLALNTRVAIAAYSAAMMARNKRGKEFVTPFRWLMWVCDMSANSDSKHAELLRAIHLEASDDLDKALAAYVSSQEGKV